MRNLVLTVAIPAIIVACTATDSEPDWQPLISEDGLAGWTPKFAGHPAGVNYRDTFKVEDGVLTVDYSDYDSFDGEFGHLFTDREFGEFDLRLQYRIFGDQVPGAPDWALRNNGVMLYAQDPSTMTTEQAFPRCVEVQFNNGGDGDGRSNGNICTPGTHVVYNGELDTRHCIASGVAHTITEDWVDVLIEVRDEGIRQYVDGQLTMAYSDVSVDANDYNHPDLGIPHGTKLTSGRIALQAESHPTQFRNVEIRSYD